MYFESIVAWSSAKFIKCLHLIELFVFIVLAVAWNKLKLIFEAHIE